MSTATVVIVAVIAVAVIVVAVAMCFEQRERRRTGTRRHASSKPFEPSVADHVANTAAGAVAKPARRLRKGALAWRELLDRHDVLILDTETTGLAADAEVIEVAVLDTTGATRFETLSLPQWEIPSAASAIHGLTRKVLLKEGARPWPDVHAELAPVLEGASVVLAWNAGFDQRMLEQTAAFHWLTLPQVQWRDLLADFRAMTGEEPRKGRHTLAATVERTGAIVNGPSHRAAGDCRAVLAIMRAVAQVSIRYEAKRDVPREWRALLDRTDVLIVDTKTTGLGDRAEVLEIAVLDTTGESRYEALSLPQGPIQRAASDVHGLTRAALRTAKARPWPEVHAELAAVLEGGGGVLTLNARFTARMLAQTAERHELSLPRLAWRDMLTDFRVMTGEAPRKGRHTLAATVERTGAIVNGPSHRAAGDCRAVLAIMRAVAHSVPDADS